MDPRNSTAHPRPAAHRLGCILGFFLLSLAFWTGLVWNTSAHDFLLGLIASAATVAFSFYVQRALKLRFDFRLADFAQCWKIPWYIASDLVIVTRVLLRDLIGRAPAADLFRVCGFDTSAHDPRRIARTSLAVAFTTTSPNLLVIDVDPATSRMLFHQLERRPVPGMAKALGARE